MEALFLSVLNMSLAAGYVILAVLILRLFLKRAPKSLSYALWSVVFFRLVCPFRFESVFSLLPKQYPEVTQEMVRTAPPLSAIPAQLSGSPNVPAPDLAMSINPMQVYVLIAAMVWLMGVAAMMLYGAGSFWLLKRRMSHAAYLEGNLYELEGLQTPFVLGIFRPKIYLPAGLGEEERRYVVLHEQSHMQRLDHVVKPLAFLVLCVHWFNPLCWAAFFLMANDMELSCDERVVRRLGGDFKKEYASCLLTFATGRHLLNGRPLAFSEGNAKQRIKNILHYQKPALWAVILAAILLVTVGFGLLSSPQSPRETLRWMQTLREDKVEKVELEVLSAEESQQYRLFTAQEIPGIIQLLRAGNGDYTTQTEDFAGSIQTLYITMKNGERHTVSNRGNRYLTIDEEDYTAPYDWLSRWHYQGNAPLPAGFPGTPLDGWAQSVAYDPQGGELQFTIPEKLDDGTYLSLHVSGSMGMGDSSTSWHAFEEESEQNRWTPGKTYRTSVLTKAMQTIELDAAIYREDGTALAQSHLQILPDGHVETLTVPEATREGGLSFPYAMGTTTAVLADGSAVDVELVMTAGRKWDSGDPDFLAGGYLQEGDNYVGQFTLQVLRGGQVLSSIPVDLGEGEDICFYGPVTLQFADYNGDGDPEFALGSWLWSGGNSYHVYRIDRAGTISQVGHIDRHDSREPSPLLELVEGGGFNVRWWNQETGEYDVHPYKWDGTSFQMDEKE